ncbi:hypothetical protein H5410_044529 [Solanum commersonii]|uniref:Uncharacterized protein n=1 Tax=Solanum commersonii TaxID=4109 RepID=A0A9J5X8S9_SOLCO|nr:hypothetical protein H5410_044529 [Solanum commersonii]
MMFLHLSLVAEDHPITLTTNELWQRYSLGLSSLAEIKPRKRRPRNYNIISHHVIVIISDLCSNLTKQFHDCSGEKIIYCCLLPSMLSIPHLVLEGLTLPNPMTLWPDLQLRTISTCLNAIRFHELYSSSTHNLPSFHSSHGESWRSDNNPVNGELPSSGWVLSFLGRASMADTVEYNGPTLPRSFTVDSIAFPRRFKTDVTRL